jgi:hypothetical protein
MGEAMTTTQIASLVRSWFEQAQQASGPILPDGWFGGRPYDNIFLLEDIEVLDDVLVIHLSEETTLSIARPRRGYVQESQLVFEDYDYAVLRWKHYGGTEYHEKRFDSGQVRLAPPIGTTVTVE